MLRDNSLIRKYSWIIGISIVFTLVVLISLYTSEFNPDYNSYESIYNAAKSLEFNQEFSAFTFLGIIINFISILPSYLEFRFFVAVAMLILFVFFLNGIGLSFYKLSLVSALGILPFLLMKIHVQIREGISLLIWFLGLLNSNSKSRIKIPFINLIFFIPSILLHTSVASLWFSSFILY